MDWNTNLPPGLMYPSHVLRTCIEESKSPDDKINPHDLALTKYNWWLLTDEYIRDEKTEKMVYQGS